MAKLHIKKDDTVYVLAGDDKGTCFLKPFMMDSISIEYLRLEVSMLMRLNEES